MSDEISIKIESSESESTDSEQDLEEFLPVHQQIVGYSGEPEVRNSAVNY